MRLTVDSALSIAAPSSALIAELVASFTTRMLVETDSQHRRFQLTRLDADHIVLEAYESRGIRTTNPLTTPEAIRILQDIVRSDGAWDRAIPWQTPVQATLRDRLRLLGLKAGAWSILCVPVGIVSFVLMGFLMGVLTVITMIPVYAYYQPRCQAFATAHGLTFIDYVYERHASGKCLTEEGAISFASTRPSWPPALQNPVLDRVFDRSIYAFLASVGLLILIVVLATVLTRRKAQRVARRARTNP